MIHDVTAITSTGAQTRARSDLIRLARAADTLDDFVARALAIILEIVPADASAIGTLDPETLIPTGGCFSQASGVTTADLAQSTRLWSELEFGAPEPSSLHQMHQRGILALGMDIETGGHVATSRRMRELFLPSGIRDEARVLGYAAGRPWAALMLFRSTTPFTTDEIAFLATLSAGLGSGVRACLVGSAYGGGTLERSGGSLVVDPDGRVTYATAAAQEWLAELAETNGIEVAEAVVPGLIARLADGGASGEVRTRVRSTAGAWFTVSAQPLLDHAGHGDGHTIVTVVRSRPADLAPLHLESLGLTPRERAVTELVMDGLDTRHIARRLGVSTYTVQDHLKSVFGKTGVVSRGQLVARIEGRC
jgi:DNA-binding CsgD family transcriptional regulator